MYIIFIILISILFAVISSNSLIKDKNAKVRLVFKNQNEDLINDAAEMCLYKIEKGIYKKKVPTNSFEDYDKILDEDTEKYIEFINSKEISDDNFTKL